LDWHSPSFSEDQRQRGGSDLDAVGKNATPLVGHIIHRIRVHSNKTEEELGIRVGRLVAALRRPPCLASVRSFSLDFLGRVASGIEISAATAKSAIEEVDQTERSNGCVRGEGEETERGCEACLRVGLQHQSRFPNAYPARIVVAIFALRQATAN
jgi:hypothetical protein